MLEALSGVPGREGGWRTEDLRIEGGRGCFESLMLGKGDDVDAASLDDATALSSSILAGVD